MGHRPYLAVRLADAGHHPAAWRLPDADAGALFTPERLVALVQSAERIGLDAVIVDDALSVQSERADRVRGRLDALLALARVAPLTSRIGLVPLVTTTHTEPFHLSKNLATLDFVSGGRAGWLVGVSTSAAEAAHFGRTGVASAADLYEEAADAVEVVRRLWDSWEDDAVIRDVATGRYIDRTKLHYIDFEGRFFSVRGPSITPRSPQAQPPVVIEASCPEAVAVAQQHADIAIVSAPTLDEAAAAADAVRSSGRDLIVLAQVDVLLEPTAGEARAARERLDALASPAPTAAAEVVGTPAELDALAAAWFRPGAIDGFVLRPARLPRDLEALAATTMPAPDERSTTLRARLGLPRPANRYEVIP